MLFQADKSSYTLRRFGRYGASEDVVREQKRFGVASELREKTSSALAAGLADEHGAQAKTAPNRLFDQFDTLYSALTASGQVSVVKCGAKLFDKTVLSAFDQSETVWLGHVGGIVPETLSRYIIPRGIVTTAKSVIPTATSVGRSVRTRGLECTVLAANRWVC